ncbi:hypothetical protein [Bacillus thuringiensis]|uniref:hypothetical protein n=1 Tax=Bacillus thuringiensis TaxID=1428 RepID=UPI002D7F71D3|nr:hypothetical protein [Bacillus thuringiensis]MEB4818362.1 hypothetical protein [Bacillus thuringiensis]
MSKEAEVFLPITEPNTSINELLEIISNIYLNGGALFYSFKVENIKIFDNVAEVPEYIEKIIIHKEVLPVLTDLEIEPPLKMKLNFKKINITDFKVQLVSNLMEGGAYSEYVEGLSKLTRIVEDACDSLFKKQINEVKVFYSSSAWSEWFGDMNWDSTWFFFDKARRKMYILCVTDMD